jgi:hypothetical protein
MKVRTAIHSLVLASTTVVVFANVSMPKEPTSTSIPATDESSKRIVKIRTSRSFWGEVEGEEKESHTAGLSNRS